MLNGYQKLRVKDSANILNSGTESLVIMDAGIASEKNIAYLVANNYEYLVVSRKQNKQFDAEQSVPVKSNNKDEVIVRAQKVVNAQTKEIELQVNPMKSGLYLSFS